MALTRRQAEVLDFIRSFIARQGYSPSLEEIGGSLGLSSVATVHKHVSHLVDKGYVRRVWNQNRSIELADDAMAGGGVEIPLLGTIAAGRPIEAVVSSETLRVPRELVAERGNVFALKVQGSSMIDDHIVDGDFVLIEKRETARRGETVVALVDGSESTLKRFFAEGANIRLQPANTDNAPIVVASDRVRVQGVVIAMIRRY